MDQPRPWPATDQRLHALDAVVIDGDEDDPGSVDDAREAVVARTRQSYSFSSAVRARPPSPISSASRAAAAPKPRPRSNRVSPDISACRRT